MRIVNLEQIKDAEYFIKPLSSMNVKWANGELWSTPDIGKPYNSFLFCEYGKIKVKDGNSELLFYGEGGDLIYTPANVVYSVSNVESNTKTRLINFKIISHDSEIIQLSPILFKIPIGGSSKVISDVRFLSDVLSTNGSVPAMASIGLYRLLTDLSIYYTENKTKMKANKIISAAVNHINQNLDKNIDIEQLARLCGVSQVWLRKNFKLSTGYSPLEYINRQRIYSACDLFKNTDKCIYEVATAVGFNDPLYFSKLFKKIVGFSPSSYREIIRVNGEKT